jgi:hypothetical protein
MSESELEAPEPTLKVFKPDLEVRKPSPDKADPSLRWKTKSSLGSKKCKRIAKIYFLVPQYVCLDAIRRGALFIQLRSIALPFASCARVATLQVYSNSIRG